MVEMADEIKAEEPLGQQDPENPDPEKVFQQLILTSLFWKISF